MFCSFSLTFGAPNYLKVKYFSTGHCSILIPYLNSHTPLSSILAVLSALATVCLATLYSFLILYSLPCLHLLVWAGTWGFRFSMFLYHNIPLVIWRNQHRALCSASLPLPLLVHHCCPTPKPSMLQVALHLAWAILVGTLVCLPLCLIANYHCLFIFLN